MVSSPRFCTSSCEDQSLDQRLMMQGWSFEKWLRVVNQIGESQATYNCGVSLCSAYRVFLLQSASSSCTLRPVSLVESPQARRISQSPFATDCGASWPLTDARTCLKVQAHEADLFLYLKGGHAAQVVFATSCSWIGRVDIEWNMYSKDQSTTIFDNNTSIQLVKTRTSKMICVRAW